MAQQNLFALPAGVPIVSKNETIQLSTYYFPETMQETECEHIILKMTNADAAKIPHDDDAKIYRPYHAKKFICPADDCEGVIHQKHHDTLTHEVWYVCNGSRLIDFKNGVMTQTHHAWSYHQLNLLLKIGGLQMAIAKTAIKVEDGVHEGRISDMVARDVKLANGSVCTYNDFVVEISGAKLKYGVPDNISVDSEGKPVSNLAKMLVAFGYKIEIGKDYDDVYLKQLFIGKPCTAIIFNEETEAGTFARIKEIKLSKKK